MYVFMYVCMYVCMFKKIFIAQVTVLTIIHQSTGPDTDS